MAALIFKITVTKIFLFKLKIITKTTVLPHPICNKPVYNKD